MLVFRKKKYVIIFLAWFMLVAISTHAHCLKVTGQVRCDGKGLEHVVVTDGTHFTQTDRKGRYQLAVSEQASFIYLSTPSGYLPARNGSRPLFFEPIDRQRARTYDFELAKNPKSDVKHTVLVHADPQLYKKENLVPYQRILADCQSVITSQTGDVFGLDCGDLVGDKPDLYAPYIEAVDQLQIPFYRVIGNHDMTLYGRSHETSYSKFESLFGPSYYSFNRGQAHYIVLNDVFYLSRDYFYAGYLTEQQLAWLEKDLSYVAPGSLVFVALHIPTRLEVGKVSFEYSNANVAGRVSNAEFLHQLLKPYKAHILSGHTHYNRNLEHSDQLFEHITAAVCGTWWQGDVCLDGTPQGYGIYEVDGDAVTWTFKSAGHPMDYQFRAYSVGTSSKHPDDILVNVWNWDVKWKVEWLEDGLLMGEMTRASLNDPAAEALCADKEKLEFKWISATPNEHMFHARVNNKKARIEVRVTDRFGNVYQSKIE